MQGNRISLLAPLMCAERPPGASSSAWHGVRFDKGWAIGSGLVRLAVAMMECRERAIVTSTLSIVLDATALRIALLGDDDGRLHGGGVEGADVGVGARLLEGVGPALAAA